MAKPKIKFVPESLHVKTGDLVYVISGKGKGKTGKVLKVFPKKGKVVVEGINMITKHMKPTPINPQGGVVTKEAAIFSSKVMLFDAKEGTDYEIKYINNVNAGYGYVAVVAKGTYEGNLNAQVVDGKKVRYSKVSGEVL